MSSILKALKKLEDEFPRKNESPTWSQNIDTKRTIKKRAQRFLYSHNITGLLLGTIIVIFGIWFFTTSVPLSDHESGKIDIQKPNHVADKINIIPKPKQKKMAASGKPQKSTIKTQAKSKPLPLKKAGLKKDKTVNPDKKKEPETPALLSPKNSSLKLQAISWAQDPKKRIAVINGMIVREGDTVEGYSLSRIGKDDVIVKKGGMESKLVFKLK